MTTAAERFKAGKLDKKKVVQVSKTSLQAATIGKLRKKERLVNITVPVSISLKTRLEEISANLNVSRAEFMRAALEYSLNSSEFISAVSV